MKNYLILILLIVTSLANAQTIHGKVQFDDTYYNEDYLQAIKIINQRTSASTLTDTSGTFEIDAEMGDKLILTSININKRIISVSEKSFQTDFIIFVEPNIIQLGEARFGYLNKELEKNKLQTQEQINTLYKNMGIDPELRYIEPKKDVSKFRASDLKNPLRLYEHFTGKNKEARKLRKYEDKANMLQHVEDLFDKEFYTIELQLPDYKIKEFIRWVNSKQDLSLMLRQSTTEMIKDVLYQRSFEYRRLLQHTKS